MILDIAKFCNQSGVLYVFMIAKYCVDIIKICVPIFLIISASINLGKVIGKPDEMKNVLPLLAKKVIAALAVFLVPTIVNYSLDSLAGRDDSSFATCVANANIEYITKLKELEEQERKDRMEQREKEAEEAAKKQHEKMTEDDEQANEFKKKQEQQNGGNNTGTGNGTNSGSAATFGEATNDKRARKTVTINGRTYDMYRQTDFPDVPFDGQNLAVAGCSAISFTQAASGFDRDITVWDGAKLTTARSFSGIMAALKVKGIPYSGPIYYNSNDFNEAAIARVCEQVRNHFKQGKPVIALITAGNNGENKYCGSNHFITIYGEDEQGRAIIGNSRVGDYGDLEEIVRYYMGGGRKGFLLIG